MKPDKKQPKAHVSEYKKKRVSELEGLIKNNRTVLVASIKNLPSAQFQEIVKTLRGKAEVKVPKKSLIFRAIDNTKSHDLKKLENEIGNSVAILFSNMDAFELAGELVRNEKPAKAKAGQTSPVDIEVPEGPTDLVPGPAITELGALGIQIQIEKGKIHIKQPKVIVKAGEKIRQPVADMINKFNLSPFTIGFEPLIAFDNETKTLYTDINIDTEKAVEDIKEAFGRALPFAVEIGFVNDETISFLLGKAGRNEKAIEGLLEKEPEKKEAEESKTEEKEDASEEEKKEEASEEKSESGEMKAEEGEKNAENKESNENKSEEEK